MALKTTVKIGGVTNLSDARYCAGMGVEMIGFDLNPESKEFVSPQKFQEITGWVAGVKYVGEFHGMSEQSIREQLVKYPLDYLEVTEPALVTALANTGLQLILKITEKEDPSRALSLLNGASPLAYVLIECKIPLNLERIAEFGDLPLLVGYELTAENALALIESVNPAGIALKGSEELKPGYKDYDELSEILEALEAED